MLNPAVPEPPRLDIDTGLTNASSAVVAVGGEIDLATGPQLCSALQAAEAACDDSVVVDLSEVTFIDCAGLTVLVGTAVEMAKHRRAMPLVCDPRGPVDWLLRLTGVGERLSVYRSVPAALTA